MLVGGLKDFIDGPRQPKLLYLLAHNIVTTFQETDLPPGERQEPRHGDSVRPPQAVRHRRGKSGAGHQGQ